VEWKLTAKKKIIRIHYLTTSLEFKLWKELKRVSLIQLCSSFRNLLLFSTSSCKKCYGNILSDLRLDTLHTIIAGCEKKYEELCATFKLIKLHFCNKFFPTFMSFLQKSGRQRRAELYWISLFHKRCLCLSFKCCVLVAKNL